MVARDIMTRDVLTIREEATVREAVELLTDAHYGAVPVVSEANQVVGVLSNQDLLRLVMPDYLDKTDLSFLPASAQFFPKCGESGCVADIQVGSFMRRDFLPKVPPGEPVAEVARIMLKQNVRRVVVVENDELVGVISRGDVVRAILQPAIDEEAETDK